MQLMNPAIYLKEFLLDSSENTLWYAVNQKELGFCPLSKLLFLLRSSGHFGVFVATG